MKHKPSVTFILIALFVLTQVVGLITVTNYIEPITVLNEEGITVTQIVHDNTTLGPQPVVKEKGFSFIPVMFAILFGTALMFVLIKFRLKKVMKTWFFLAIFLTLSVSFGVYISSVFAFTIAFILALLRVYRPNIIIHNFTEIFIYTGISVLILPLFDIYSASVLLVLISIYDIYAVWKSKHMVKLAQFQTENKMFAGLFLQYDAEPKKRPWTPHKVVKVTSKKPKSAILGGGDIAFPLIFSSVVLEHLIMNNNLTKIVALSQSLIISLCVTIAISILFYVGKKDKFYPAMPFVSIGCFVGLGLIYILNILI